MESICSYSFDEYLQMIESFHGSVAPGLVVGGFMIDLAMRELPEGVLIDAVCETPSCLPDAIQLLTPCTIGNGWLKVVNLGRFALSLYEKHGGAGVRVFLDAGKLEEWPEIKAWLYKLKTKGEQDKDELIAEIRRAGLSICGVRPVRVARSFREKKSKGRIGTCTSCGEPYPVQDGAVCRGCQGEAPYESDL